MVTEQGDADRKEGGKTRHPQDSSWRLIDFEVLAASQLVTELPIAFRVAGDQAESTGCLRNVMLNQNGRADAERKRER